MSRKKEGRKDGQKRKGQRKIKEGRKVKRGKVKVGREKGSKGVRNWIKQDRIRKE